MSSFHAPFLQIHLSFSFICLSSTLLLFLGKFSIYFTYTASKLPILRHKHLQNPEDNLVWNTAKLWVVLYDFFFRIRETRNLQLVSCKYCVRKGRVWLSFRDYCFSPLSFSELELVPWKVNAEVCVAHCVFPATFLIFCDGRVVPFVCREKWVFEVGKAKCWSSSGFFLVWRT